MECALRVHIFYECEQYHLLAQYYWSWSIECILYFCLVAIAQFNPLSLHVPLLDDTFKLHHLTISNICKVANVWMSIWQSVFRVSNTNSKLSAPISLCVKSVYKIVLNWFYRPALKQMLFLSWFHVCCRLLTDWKCIFSCRISAKSPSTLWHRA